MSRGDGRLRSDLLPALLVAALVFQLIRTNLCERYRVTSRSMEPALHGDPETGDIVLVDRTAWWTDLPRHGDLVVVRNRERPGENHLVKRLIAIGPSKWVKFERGDLFVSDQSQVQLGDRVVKHPVRHRDMRVLHAAWPHAAWSTPDFLRREEARWRVADGVLRVSPTIRSELEAATTTEAQDRRAASQPPDPYLPGFVSLRAPVNPDFVDGRGERCKSGGAMPHDIGIELEFCGSADLTALVLVYEYAENYFTLRWSKDGQMTLALHGEVLASFVAPKLVPGTESKIEFGYLDGRFFTVIDGDTLHEHAFALPRESRVLIARSDRMHNLLHFAAECADARPTGGSVAALDVSSVRAFRDVHYSSETGAAFRIEDGQMFVLGDNSFDSSDSRDRIDDPFEVTDLIGRPVAIIGPAGRSRWLPRYPNSEP